MNDLLEKNQHLIILYDFYGPLLTIKQQKYFEMYYFEDLSLAEIAEGAGVSRNAIFDTIKKVAKLLDKYESKMQLLKHNQKVMKLLNELKQYTDSKGHKIIEQLENE